MKKCFLAAAALMLLVPSTLPAQDAFANEPSQSLQGPTISAPAAENRGRQSGSWGYRESAREAIHRREAWKAAQRVRRLEAMKWQGYMPSRPPASPLPFMAASPGDRGNAYPAFPGMLLR